MDFVLRKMYKCVRLNFILTFLIILQYISSFSIMYKITNSLGSTPFYVSFGSYSLLRGRSSIKTKSVHIHPHFSKFQNDIGLIELEEDIIFNENVKPVKLPKSNSDLVGDSVAIAGWGPYKIGVCI